MFSGKCTVCRGQGLKFKDHRIIQRAVSSSTASCICAGSDTSLKSYHFKLSASQAEINPLLLIYLKKINHLYFAITKIYLITLLINCKININVSSKLSMAYQCVGCNMVTLQPLGGFKPNPSEKYPLQTKAYLPTGPPIGEHCVHCNQRHHVSIQIYIHKVICYKWIC